MLFTNLHQSIFNQKDDYRMKVSAPKRLAIDWNRCW